MALKDLWKKRFCAVKRPDLRLLKAHNKVTHFSIAIFLFFRGNTNENNEA